MYIRKQRLSDRIEDCLYRIDRGEDLLDVLADYPDQGDYLKSILLVAMASRAFPVPNPDMSAQRFGINHLYSEMENLKANGLVRKTSDIPRIHHVIGNISQLIQSRNYGRLALSYRLATVALVLVFSGGFLTLSASASSRPGDALYGLKKGMQRVQQVIGFAGLLNNRSSHLDSEADDLEPGANKGLGIGVSSEGFGDGSWGNPAEDFSQGSSNIQGNEKPDPSSGNEKTNNGNQYGHDKQDGLETFSAEADDIPGRALGHEKENPGKSLGNDKEQDESPGVNDNNGKENNGKGNGKDKDDKDKDKDK